MAYKNEGITVNNEVEALFNFFGMSALRLKMHMIKHLNRRGLWKCYVPEWTQSGWKPRYTVFIKEELAGFINERMEKILNAKEGELGNQNYTIFFELYDTVLGMPVARGVAINRNDMFKEYQKMLRNAIKLRNSLTGSAIMLAPEEEELKEVVQVQEG